MEFTEFAIPLKKVSRMPTILPPKVTSSFPVFKLQILTVFFSVTAPITSMYRAQISAYEKKKSSSIIPKYRNHYFGYESFCFTNPATRKAPPTPNITSGDCLITSAIPWSTLSPRAVRILSPCNTKIHSLKTQLFLRQTRQLLQLTKIERLR